MFTAIGAGTFTDGEFSSWEARLQTTESFHVSSSRDSNRFHPSTHPNSELKLGTLARHTALSVTTSMSQLSHTKTKLRFWRVCQPASTTTELKLYWSTYFSVSQLVSFNLRLRFNHSVFFCLHSVYTMSQLSYYITVAQQRILHLHFARALALIESLQITLAN